MTTTDAADPRTAPSSLPRWRADLRLGSRIVAMRAGGLALAVRGDPVARLMHKPWRLDPYPTYARVRDAGAATGESWWPMPLSADLDPDVDSTIADVRQAPGGPGGIAAALFLRRFTDGRPWAHLDIAGPARCDSPH